MRRSSKKLPNDPNQLAAEIVRLSTEETARVIKKTLSGPIVNYLALIGQRGGLKGGPARAKKLSPKKRRDIAKKAAMARWKAQQHSD